jgi:hypothetical protein
MPRIKKNIQGNDNQAPETRLANLNDKDNIVILLFIKKLKSL